MTTSNTRVHVDEDDETLLTRLAEADPLAAALVRRKDAQLVELRTHADQERARLLREIDSLNSALDDARNSRRAARFFGWLFVAMAWFGGFALAVDTIWQFVHRRLSDGKAVPLVLLSLAVMAVAFIVAQSRSDP